MLARAASAIIGFVALLGVAAAQPGAPPAPQPATQPTVRELRFASGRTAATVSDAVVRGEKHLWSFEARAGQEATVAIRAPERNAVFQIWRPGARIAAVAPVEIEGEALPGAGEAQDARRWQGRLPASGRYLVVVGPSRGNASYTLTLQIRR